MVIVVWYICDTLHAEPFTVSPPISCVKTDQACCLCSGPSRALFPSNRQWEIIARGKGPDLPCPRLHWLKHQRPLYALKDVKNWYDVKAKGGAKFWLSCQEVFCSLTVNRLVYFATAWKLLGVESLMIMLVHAWSRHWKRCIWPDYSKKPYFVRDLLRRTVCTVYATAGAGSARRIIHVPSVL